MFYKRELTTQFRSCTSITAAVNEIRIVSVRQIYADLCRTLEIIAARSSLHQFIHKTASFGNIIAVRAAFCKKNRQP